jgi:hypothetical protein
MAPLDTSRGVSSEPNGNASVFLRPVVRDDGSLELVSPAAPFGGPGFYFVVRAD